VEDLLRNELGRLQPHNRESAHSRPTIELIEEIPTSLNGSQSSQRQRSPLGPDPPQYCDHNKTPRESPSPTAPDLNYTPPPTPGSHTQTRGSQKRDFEPSGHSPSSSPPRKETAENVSLPVQGERSTREAFLGGGMDPEWKSYFDRQFDRVAALAIIPPSAAQPTVPPTGTALVLEPGIPIEETDDYKRDMEDIDKRRV
jgi:hypothetical protein